MQHNNGNLPGGHASSLKSTGFPALYSFIASSYCCNAYIKLFLFFCLLFYPSLHVHASERLLLVCMFVTELCSKHHESLPSHWTFFDAAWKLNYSSVLTTATYNCQTTLLLRDSLSLSRSFLLWRQPWSLSTIMLLWHSFLIINNNNNHKWFHQNTSYSTNVSLN